MTNNKDTASFFENGTTEQFEYCFKLYPQALKLKAEKRCKKPQELIRLDQWYQNELPKLIKARGKDAHMVYDELVQTMKWKQSRGKFYPQLSYLVKVNTPRAVMQETKKAFRKLPNLEQAITALSNLKGVGTTMASALLAAAAPDSAPFMADECLMAIPEIEGIDYTTKEYLNFVQHIQSTVERLNAQAGGGGGGGGQQWSPHRVELALWAHYVANDLNPELLDQMPSGGSKTASANGSTVKTIVTGSGDSIDADDAAEKVLAAGGDDTNDNEDTNESLTAARGGETNNTATESETDNENTNPIPTIMVNNVSAGVLQDGDSNFISNDSTSQEDVTNANVIDEENTTQTTATTSTDDGEVGTNTPLASDSESNMEAPAKSSSSNNNIATSTTETDSNIAIDSSNAAVAAAAATDHQSIIHNSDNVNKAVVGNGNGTLIGVGGIVNDSLDGESSSCIRSRSSANEEASEEGYDEFDESNSNSVSGGGGGGSSSGRCVVGHKSATSIVSDSNDTTLSNVAGQKRSMLQCNNAATEEQPDIKKIRND